MKQVNFKCDEHLFKVFKLLAKKNNIDASKLFRTYIEEYIKDNKILLSPTLLDVKD